VTNDELTRLLTLAEAGRRTRVVPALLSTDLARTEEFYVRLGFTAEPVDGGRQGFERDGYFLFFFTEPPHGTPATPAMSGTIYFFPDSVDELAEEWRGTVEFLWGPELMPYGLYEFGIADPDGYVLAFAERRA
jgi:hypothetical protein